MKRLTIALAVATLAAASPAAAFDFPEQPDTNPGAEDNGCAAILGHPGVVTSVANEADRATAIRTQIFVDACLGGP
jgi:hypothetical protein